MGNRMAIAPSARIHPTAVISDEADIGDNVSVGPFAVIDGPVTIGPDCIIKAHACLVGPLTMGRGNVVFPNAVLGERPQHLKYNDEPTGVDIGAHNTFREGVTVHRGTTQAMVTRIGHHNYFMVNAHVAHDCQIGNRCIFANGALLGGHCIIEDSVFLSGNSAVQQFCRIGRLAFLSGCSTTTKDIPPFVMNQRIDTTVGLNLIGMRRAGMTPTQINGVRRAFRILFREGCTLPVALARIDAELGQIDSVQEMLAFLRRCHKGISPARGQHREDAA